MFSPVSGSRPWKWRISPSWMAWRMSLVPGNVPAFRPEVEVWILPLLSMNCSSMWSLSSKLSVVWTAIW